jgi:hypothetical protein
MSATNPDVYNEPKSADRKSSTVSFPLTGEEEGEGEIVTRKFTPPLATVSRRAPLGKVRKAKGRLRKGEFGKSL